MEEKALEPRGTTAPVTRKHAMYLLATIWPDVPETEIVKAAMLCQQYNLNPLMKQIYIIPFSKKGGGTTYATVLGIGASRAIAQSKGFKYSYNDGPRVMTDEEQVSILGEIDPKNIWAITKIIDREGNVFPGYGSWPKDTDVYGSDKGNSKRNMSFIRSERAALDRMAPGTLPDVEIYDESYSPVIPAKEIAAGKEEHQRRVQEDIEDFWPDSVPKIDMDWVRENVRMISQEKPILYRRLGDWLRKASEGRQFPNWWDAVQALDHEKQARFVELVQKCLDAEGNEIS